MKTTAKTEIILKSKQRRNAFWYLELLNNGKYKITMNGKTQRIFSDRDEAIFFFDLWISK